MAPGTPALAGELSVCGAGGALTNPDLELLLDEHLSFARQMVAQMVAEHGECFPFGGYIDRDGASVHVGARRVRS